MLWRLGDGTVVHLGGDVEGTTPLAEKLREDAANARAGYPCAVCTLPPPGMERLRLDDAWHVHCWVRDEAMRAGVEVTEAPEVTAPAEWDEPSDPGAVH